MTLRPESRSARVDPRRRTVTALCGLGAAGLAVLVPAAGGLGEPGYSHVAQFVSELGASGARHATLVSFAGFVPIGGLTLAFLGRLRSVLPRSRCATAGLACLALVGVAYVASALFPCDAGCPAAGSPSQSVHNTFGFLEYAGALAGLLLLGLSLRDALAWRALAVASLAAATFVALGLAAMLAPDLAAYRGLSQRVAEVAIFAWVACASLLVLRRAAIERGVVA